MKQLSIEQKAQRFDEAIKKAKKWYNANTNEGYRGIFEEIFPELKESEGEEMWKKILELIAKHCGRTCEMYLWLEKQGEQYYKIIKGKNYFCVKTHNYAGVEWIKGTKYYASDNYTLVNQGCECYCPEYSKEEHNNLFEEVKCDDCVEKQGEQKPAEWHRENEQNLNACLGYIPDEFLRRWLTDTIHIKYDNLAWSKEDEEIHRKCICAMRASACGFPEEEKFVEQVNNWLISLKNRYIWKPSDVQMDAIKDAIDYLGENTKIVRKHLISLYDQLKKLKE